jgi:hypothetical protein
MDILSFSADIQFMIRHLHPTQQELEQFVLGRLGTSDAPGVVQVEEHLLICSHCVNAAEHALEFAHAIQRALSTTSTESICTLYPNTAFGGQ